MNNLALKNLLTDLSVNDKEKLYHLLDLEFSKTPNLTEVNSGISQDIKVFCPHCEGSDLYGHGTYKGRKRYKCKKCNTTFNDFTGTAISGIKIVKEFEKYIAMAIARPTIREVSKELEINKSD